MYKFGGYYGRNFALCAESIAGSLSRTRAHAYNVYNNLKKKKKNMKQIIEEYCKIEEKSPNLFSTNLRSGISIISKKNLPKTRK